MNDKKVKNEKVKRYIASEILPSGEIIELVYREEYQETQLAVFKDGEVEYLDKLERPQEILLPHPATKDLIRKKVILFPSEAIDYVSEKELIGKIQRFLHKYLDISPFFERIASYYVLFSWVYDRFNELPYLRAIGDYGSGKSRLLKVVGSLSYKPMFTGGATTTSPIFRIIDMFRGTLILDEADFRFSDTTTEIVKILNSGYQKGTAVLRSEGKGTFEVKSFDVYGPKIVATRETYRDLALESRFLIERMEKKELREDIPINLPESFENEALELRNQLLMWRFKNATTAKLKLEDIDKTLEPRLNQIIMPLLSIINDPEIKKEIKAFIKEYDSQLITDRGMSFESGIFEAFLECLLKNPEPTIKDVTEAFNDNQPPKMGIKVSRVGNILRKQLNLKARRINRGYAISELENQERIKSLKRKFGIPDSEVNPVYPVNPMEDKETPELF